MDVGDNPSFVHSWLAFGNGCQGSGWQSYPYQRQKYGKRNNCLLKYQMEAME